MSNELRGKSFRCSRGEVSKRSACRLTPGAKRVYPPYPGSIRTQQHQRGEFCQTLSLIRMQEKWGETMCVTHTPPTLHIHLSLEVSPAKHLRPMRRAHTQANTSEHLHTHTMRHMPLIKVMIHNIWCSRSAQPEQRAEQSIGLGRERLTHWECSDSVAKADRLMA